MAFVVDTKRAAEWLTVADLRRHLGGIPSYRIRMVPTPGTAEEKDLLWVQDHEDRNCELIDGILVDKTVGWLESRLALALAYFLERFLEGNDLGIVTGEGGPMRILAKQIRMPDVAFFSWRHFPNRKLPDSPVPHLAPDLAVEILSKGNTKREMQRKLREYFAAGVRLVWYIDPRKRQATIYISPDQAESIPAHGSLTGGDVLPGFALPLSALFARAEGRTESTT
jgi:Uma2 family endonuclease